MRIFFYSFEEFFQIVRITSIIFILILGAFKNFFKHFKFFFGALSNSLIITQILPVIVNYFSFELQKIFHSGAPLEARRKKAAIFREIEQY